MAHKVGTPILQMILQLGEKSITIGEGSGALRLLSSGMDGLEAPEAATEYRENAQLDGSYPVSARIPGRDITLLFEIADHANREMHRRELISFFDPKASGTLTVVRGRTGLEKTSRTIGCSLCGRVEMTQESLYHYVRVRVPLYCRDPYFYADAVTRALTRSAAGLLTFPLTLTADSGVTAGEVTVGNTFPVENQGDTETGFHLLLRARPYETDGTCYIDNPTVTRLEDGKFIRILTTMQAGDTIVISTLPGSKYILKNGESCMRFDRESTFFPLLRGTNTLMVSSSSAAGGLVEAALTYRFRYHGT